MGRSAHHRAARSSNRSSLAAIAAGAVIVSLLLAGCSTRNRDGSTTQDADSGQTSVTEPESESGVTEAEGTDGGDAGDAGDASELTQTAGCEWISTDDAAAVLGAPITATGATSGHVGAIDDCNFGTDPTADAPYGRGITYQVIDRGSDDGASSALVSMGAEGPDAGIGDESFLVGTAGIAARFGRVTSVVVITGMPDGIDAATTLQQLIAPHIGG